jgi:hypothetical protein
VYQALILIKLHHTQFKLLVHYLLELQVPTLLHSTLLILVQIQLLLYLLSVIKFITFMDQIWQSPYRFLLKIFQLLHALHLLIS